jgi:cyclopropane fatty-acyl-phospholipid synthase-like methyltransferase
VDYGCGSLRLGRHLIKYLAPGNFWGLDITRRFIQEGLDVIDPAVLADKKPHLLVISAPVVEEVRRHRPEFVVSTGVMHHVPPEEIDEYLGNLMRMVTEHGRLLIRTKLAQQTVQHSPSKPSWRKCARSADTLTGNRKESRS